MQNVSVDFAVISPLALKQSHGRPGLTEDEKLTVTMDDLRHWRSVMDTATGMGIMVAQSVLDIELFLNRSVLFDRIDRHAWKLNLGKLTELVPNAPTMETKLLDAMDPSVNYPMALIEASGLLPALEDHRGEKSWKGAGPA